MLTDTFWHIALLIFELCGVWILAVMKIFITSVSLFTLFIGLSSCEKHDWNKTKQLYESHDKAGHGEAGHAAEHPHSTHEETHEEERAH